LYGSATEVLNDFEKAHKSVGLFLEIDGISKFEREVLPLGASLLQRRSA
jgi:hypothetical protein